MIDPKTLTIGLMTLGIALLLIPKLIACEAEKYADEAMAKALRKTKTGDAFAPYRTTKR